MTRSAVAKRILENTPTRVQRLVRKYANAFVKNNKEKVPTTCKNCKCTDLEDWLGCNDKKN